MGRRPKGRRAKWEKGQRGEGTKGRGDKGDTGDEGGEGDAGDEGAYRIIGAIGFFCISPRNILRYFLRSAKNTTNTCGNIFASLKIFAKIPQKKRRRQTYDSFSNWFHQYTFLVPSYPKFAHRRGVFRDPIQV